MIRRESGKVPKSDKLDSSVSGCVFVCVRVCVCVCV